MPLLEKKHVVHTNSFHLHTFLIPELAQKSGDKNWTTTYSADSSYCTVFADQLIYPDYCYKLPGLVTRPFPEQAYKTNLCTFVQSIYCYNYNT